MRSICLKTFSILGFVAIVLSGCLKDKEYDDMERGINIDGSKKLVEISGPITGFINVDLVGSDNDTIVNVVRVRLASESPAAQDLQVTLALDPTLVTEYNAEHGTNYTVPDASLYTIPSLTVTIPKGSRDGILQLTASPNDLLGEEYALGFRITSVSDPSVIISGNYRTQVAGLTIRNQYDGVYTLQFAFYHPTASPGYDQATTTVELHTSGANSVKIYYPPFSGYYHPILSGGGITAFGAQEPEFTINPATNKVTVQNSYPGAVTFYEMAAGYDSHYDPATRTIYAKFGYNYSPGTVFNPATNREWTDTLIYVGPR